MTFMRVRYTVSHYLRYRSLILCFQRNQGGGGGGSILSAFAELR